MPSSAEITEEKLTAAMRAVVHVLNRICVDPKAADLMGHCTESYELLCQAMATYKGQTVAEVMETFEPARPAGERRQAVTHGNVVLPRLEEAVCEELNVAPCVAAQVVAHAWRRGLDLFAPGGADVDEPMLRHAANLMHTAWISWIDRRLTP